MDKNKDDIKFRFTFGKNVYRCKQKPTDTVVRLKATISKQVMLKAKERYGCDNLKVIHLGPVIDDNVVIIQQFSQKYEHKVLLLGNKSPNTLKSPDKEVHEDGEKSCSTSTKKSLVVKPHTVTLLQRHCLNLCILLNKKLQFFFQLYNRVVIVRDTILIYSSNRVL